MTRNGCVSCKKQLTNVKLLIVDELGYVPFMAIGAELLYEVFSQRYAHSATPVTSSLPLDDWASTLGSERTDQLVD
jgi:DNA replication protein DnaC